MKRLCMCWSIVLVASLMVPAVAQAGQPQTTALNPVEAGQGFEVGAMAPVEMSLVPPACGSPCDVEGAVGACQYDPWTEGLCECTNGTWECFLGGC